MTTYAAPHDAALKDTNGQTLALQKVEITGRVDELLFKVKLRQFYKNDTNKNLETIYTFPLAWGSTLLGVSAEIAGKHWQGVVIEKQKALDQYEDAIKEGDTPIMVEKSGDGLDGLYTAHLGNLKIGEVAVIEIEYAQLLKFDHGQVRLHIPTTVAPRYGDPVKTGKLARPASVDADQAANYPFSLQLQLCGSVAQGAVSCPSHQVSTMSDSDMITVSLNRNGYLDRDFNLLIDQLASRVFNTAIQDDDQFVILSSFSPATALPDDHALQLKILVDCSGSMGGESIEQARVGLRELAKQLRSADKVSYSLFGSDVLKVTGALQDSTPEFISSKLLPAIDSTEANMGGTEMHRALTSTFAISAKRLAETTCSVLLITDGFVWDIANIIATAIKSRHRIFAVGVGSEPADSLLRELTEQTGGACELVTPNEDMASAIVRMVAKMRTSAEMHLNVNWHGTPSWTSPIPKSVFPGETIHLFAFMNTLPSTGPAISWTGANPESLPAGPLSFASDKTLARLGAARKIRSIIDNTAEATKLAIKYQLVTKNSSLFMVAKRADDDKAVGLPQATQIKHMRAHDWGNNASLRILSSKKMAAPSSVRQPYLSMIKAHDKSLPGIRSQKLADFLNDDSSSHLTGCTPVEFLELFDDLAFDHTRFEDILILLIDTRLPEEIKRVVDMVSLTTGNQVSGLGIFLDWLSFALKNEHPLSRHGKRLIGEGIHELHFDLCSRIFDVLSAAIPQLSLNYWGFLNLDFLPENLQATLMDHLSPK